MREEIPPDGLVNHRPGGVLHGRAAGHHGRVGAARVLVDVGGGDEPTRVAVGRRHLVHVHYRPKLIEAEQLPGTAVVIGGPAAVEHVAEAEEPIRRRGRRHALPGLRVVAGAGEHHDAIDRLVDGEACRRGGAVRDAGHADLLPAEILPIVGEKLSPSAFWMLAVEPEEELSRPLHHAVGLRDVDERARVLAGRRLQADAAEHVAGIADIGLEPAEPAVGVVDLDAVQAVGGDPFEERLAVIHQPDHEFSLGRHARVDDCVLEVHRLALVVVEDEPDLGMFLGEWIDLAGTCREIVSLAWNGSLLWRQLAELVLELRRDQRGHFRVGLTVEVDQIARDEFPDSWLDQAIDVDDRHIEFAHRAFGRRVERLAIAEVVGHVIDHAVGLRCGRGGEHRHRAGLAHECHHIPQSCGVGIGLGLHVRRIGLRELFPLEIVRRVYPSELVDAHVEVHDIEGAALGQERRKAALLEGRGRCVEPVLRLSQSGECRFAKDGGLAVESLPDPRKIPPGNRVAEQEDPRQERVFDHDGADVIRLGLVARTRHLAREFVEPISPERCGGIAGRVDESRAM